LTKRLINSNNIPFSGTYVFSGTPRLRLDSFSAGFAKTYFKFRCKNTELIWKKKKKKTDDILAIPVLLWRAMKGFAAL
jgi:hypothetical protein